MTVNRSTVYVAAIITSRVAARWQQRDSVFFITALLCYLKEFKSADVVLRTAAVIVSDHDSVFSVQQQSIASTSYKLHYCIINQTVQ